ncbi:MAG: molecular chaperone HtpG [Spirochaetaceae bacterium]|jgi:molecular chaperone HtpG|nr:molecular chaperone HtpG [Spirochaetaceae bacterium]GMO28307.1 MAG: molecular chaperone HtpG [Termitinemataceae bacterium]
MAQCQFQTEVSELLHLIIHSLYSNREIFLREIVSNASDALDKLKYLTVAKDEYKSLVFEPRIDINFSEEAKTITISDNGIGMNDSDLAQSLGTIARSGTKAFLKELGNEAKKNNNLIGQFGVGFYSAFMVAKKIEVTSRKALEERAWKWTSDGKEYYEIEEAKRETHGTTVQLYLNDEGAEFASRWRIENIIKQYSNHVAFAIFLTFNEKEWDDKGNVKGNVIKTERINDGTAIWRKPKNELKEEDYIEFYKQTGHDSEAPLLHIHTRAEGQLEYNTLFYIPKKAPFDMFNADYKSGVKLYVKRVFITDDDKELLPVYLRFVRGIIDSEDLPLNVSREILQQNKILVNIKNASVKKLLSEFKSLSESSKEKYEEFISQYNRPLKEGLYSDWGNTEILTELIRFKSSKVEGRTSFSDYVSRMGSEQKHIYYISGGDEKTLKASPLLEAYRAKDIEVLVMDEEIDEIVIPRLGQYKKVTGVDKDGKETYKEWEIKSVGRAGADEEIGETVNKDAETEARPVIESIKTALGDKVKDVRLSRRLRDSPSCIVADENDPSMQMLNMLKAMGQTENLPEFKPILEINGEHPVVKSLAGVTDSSKIEDTAQVLLCQALLVEGLKLSDPADFVHRLNRLLS